MKSKHKRNQHIREPWRKRRTASAGTSDTALGDIGAAAIGAGASAATGSSAGKDTGKRNRHIREPWRNRKRTRRPIETPDVGGIGGIGVAAGVGDLAGPAIARPPASTGHDDLAKHGYLVDPYPADDPFAGLTDAGTVSPGARKRIHPTVHNPAFSEDNPDPMRPRPPRSIKTLADFNRWAETGATALDKRGMPIPDPDEPTPAQWYRGFIPGKPKPQPKSAKPSRRSLPAHTRYGDTQSVQPAASQEDVQSEASEAVVRTGMGLFPSMRTIFDNIERAAADPVVPADQPTLSEEAKALLSRDHVAHPTPESLQAADRQVQKVNDPLGGKWVDVDDGARTVVAGLVERVGVDRVMRNSGLISALQDGDYREAAASLQQFAPALSIQELAGYVDRMQSAADFVAANRKRIPEREYDYKDGYPRPGENPSGIDDSSVHRPGARRPLSPPAADEKPTYETKADFSRVGREQADSNEEGFSDTAYIVDNRLTMYGTDLDDRKYVVEKLRLLGKTDYAANELFDAWIAEQPIDKDLAKDLLGLYVAEGEEEVRGWLGTDEHGRSVYDALPGRAKEVLSKLHYQHGGPNLAKYVMLRRALRSFDFDAAGWEVWDSKRGRNYNPADRMGGEQVRRMKHAEEMQEVTEVMNGKPESEIGK